MKVALVFTIATILIDLIIFKQYLDEINGKRKDGSI